MRQQVWAAICLMSGKIFMEEIGQMQELILNLASVKWTKICRRLAWSRMKIIPKTSSIISCPSQSNNKCKFKCSQNNNRWHILRSTEPRHPVSSSIRIIINLISWIQRLSGECPHHQAEQAPSIIQCNSNNISSKVVNLFCKRLINMVPSVEPPHKQSHKPVNHSSKEEELSPMQMATRAPSLFSGIPLSIATQTHHMPRAAVKLSRINAFS